MRASVALSPRVLSCTGDDAEVGSTTDRLRVVLPCCTFGGGEWLGGGADWGGAASKSSSSKLEIEPFSGLARDMKILSFQKVDWEVSTLSQYHISPKTPPSHRHPPLHLHYHRK